MLNRRDLIRCLPFGLAFGGAASAPAIGQTTQDLTMRIDGAAERIRELPLARIIADSAKTAPVLTDIVRAVVSELRPGLSTSDIDTDIQARILAHGLVPSMLGFNGYPSASAMSVGPAFLHAPPSDQVISEGDLLTIQTSASSQMSHASLGVTVPIGCPSGENQRLLEGCRQSLDNAVGVVRAGIPTGVISHEIQRALNAAGLSVIRDFVGYSMGQERIQRPQILGYGATDRGDVLEAGMILNIHVMATFGDARTRVGPDNWTTSTRDGSAAALTTAMVLVEEGGGVRLTPDLGGDLMACAAVG